MKNDFLIMALLLFLIGAMIQGPIVVLAPKIPPKEVEPPPETKGSSKSGPGWHFTWSWAPLEEGSRYCNNCGRKIN